MLPRHPLYARTYEAAKGLQNPDLRRKMFCLLRGMKLQNVELTCRQFGIGRSTYYVWLNRLKEADFSPKALCPRKKTPHRQPRVIGGVLKEKILSLRQEFHYGPSRLAWYLRKMGFSVSPHGVYNVLKRAWVAFRKRRDRKPNRHTLRYELDRPGQGFQLDIKYVPFRIEKKKAYVFSAIDECSRWRFSFAYRHLGAGSAVDFAQRLVQACPFSIERIQTDNGVEFTNRFNRQSPDYEIDHPFPALLRTLRILHKLIPPGIKELNGKVERSFKTDDQEFYWKLPRFITFGELQIELERWIFDYNSHRPHSSLGMRTPMARLADFGEPSNVTRDLFDSIPVRPPLAVTMARKLRSAGKSHPYFDKYLPQKRKLSGAEALLRLSQPLPSLCNICGNTTLKLFDGV